MIEFFSYMHAKLISDVLQDACIIFGFISAIHNMMTDALQIQSKESKEKCLNEIKKFLDEIFQGRNRINRFSWVDKEGNRMDSVGEVDWAYFEKCLTKEQLAIFRAFSRIAYYLPHEPIYDLLKYYDWDLKKRAIKNESDFMEFGNYVYGCIIDTGLFLYCYKTNQWLDNFGAATEYLFERIRKLGIVCIKLLLPEINIGRRLMSLFKFSILQCYFLLTTCLNIFSDSLTAGRCYIPTNYFQKDEYMWLTEEQNPFEVDDEVLKQCTDRLIISYRKLINDAINSFELLPNHLQAFAVSVVCIAQNIAQVISDNSVYEINVNISKTKLLSIGLTGIYFGNIDWLHVKPKPEKQHW